MQDRTEQLLDYASGRFQTQAEVKRLFESFPDFPHLKNGTLTQQRVTDLLTHPIYAGYICSKRYGINWLKGQHDPLISLETFDKVQERRAGKAKAPKHKNIGDVFAVRGMVACAGCDTPLRSSISKGNGGSYPYYLCQTKGCESYGKSIKRDVLEDAVGAILKSLQPSKSLATLATAMFRHLWTARRDQAAEVIRTGNRQIKAIDTDIDKLLDLIMASTNTTAIRKYEETISQHEHGKARLAEKLSAQAEPKGSFEEYLEPALAVLASPWKIWETSGETRVKLRRTVLKLAFKDRIKYCRNRGPEPQI